MLPGGSGMTCQETAGFLFAHSCKLPPAAACTTCGKAICAQHMGVSAAGMPTCVACRGTTPSDGEDPYSYAESECSDYHDYDPYDRFKRSDREVFEGSTGTSTGDEWEGDFDAS